MNSIEIVSRRGFLGTVFSAGALVIGSRLIPENAEAAATWQPSVYFGLEPDGTAIIIAHRSEMGTGIRTALPMVLAEELDIDWKNVRIEQALGDAKYGSQDTDGSCSIRDFYDLMREAGAGGRLMLERAAAGKWAVAASECHAKNGQVIHTASGRKLSYGELVSLASQQPAPKKEDLKFKSPAEYKYVGKSLPIVDLNGICSGKAVFGMDATMPGMVYASVERPPVLGGKVKTCDDQEARKVLGVTQTVMIDPFKPPHAFQALGGVAVIADNTWAAMQGRKKLKIEWEDGDNGSYDSTTYKAELRATASKPCKSVRSIGDVDAAFAQAAKTHEAEYYVPLLSHASMEPPVAVAEFKDGKVVAWTSTQNPQAVQEAVAGALGIDKTAVTCHVNLLGGGFGRKSKPDYAVEAAMLSKKLGKPVKVTWSREDDIRFDYYHSVAAMYMKAATDAGGKPTAWLQRSVFPPIGSLNDVAARYGAGEMGMGWNDLPYAIPNHRAENGPAQAHVRIGWMRSVANIYHAFAINSFVDELAAAANRDRVDYLLETIGPNRIIDLQARGRNAAKFPVDTARLRRVIELVAEKSDWANRKPTKGRALGIAAHRSFFSYVAAVVEVEVDSTGKVHIPRVDIAADVGQVIHRDRVVSQFEGAAVFGASIAMLGEITAAKGRIQQSNFHNYQVARMNDAPMETRVHLVDSTAPPAGVGEPGVPPIAPAICNAIFAATGKRIRDLPIRKVSV
jgi:isoquinoline 1-oxidoreductase subunit beta